MSNRPDFNKRWDGTDIYLCWAAAAANALSYTGWANETPEEIFDLIKRETGNIGNAATAGIYIYIRRHLKNISLLNMYVKILPSSSLWVCHGMRERGACAILGLLNDYSNSGHVITAYETVPKEDVETEDVRSIKQFICTDSDDTSGEILPQEREFAVNVDYDLVSKQLNTDYILNQKKSFINLAVLILPRS